jgi:hypothetical protein
VSDRRAAFFAIAAAVCFALVPVAEPDLRWVPWVVGSVYVLLSLASAADHRSRRRER